MIGQEVKFMDFVIVLEEYADQSDRNAFVDRINNCIDFDWEILDRDFHNVEYFGGKDPPTMNILLLILGEMSILPSGEIVMELKPVD